MNDHPFDTELCVARYRQAVADLEAATDEPAKDEYRRIAQRLRKQWNDWQGEDSLHEMAFGEDVDE